MIRLLVLLLVTFISCGGGSIGTGTSSGSTFSGEVRTAKGEPVNNATILVLGSGESIKTDESGKFVIGNIDNTTPLELEIKTEYGTDRISITPQTLYGGIQISIEVDTNGKLVVADKLEISAGIYGRCDKSFENNRIIRQSNRLPENTVCTVKVNVKGDNRPLDDIPFILEARGCAGIHPWKLESYGYTRETGVGQLNFKFKSDAAHCEYRLKVPYNVKGLQEIIYEIHPFTKQNYDKKKN